MPCDLQHRVVTDRLADLLLTPSADADENLKAEGVEASKIHLVGNVMIDTLLKFLPAAGFLVDRWGGRRPGLLGLATLAVVFLGLGLLVRRALALTERVSSVN